MRLRTSKNLVPFALCAIGLFALVLQGCSRDSVKPEPPRDTPESYMKDAAFLSDLEMRREARTALERTHAKLAREMKAMIEAKLAVKKIEKPTAADLEAVKAELEQDPEWKSLYRRCADAAQAVEENRRAAMGAVRARIAPQKPADGTAQSK